MQQCNNQNRECSALLNPCGQISAILPLLQPMCARCADVRSFSGVLNASLRCSLSRSSGSSVSANIDLASSTTISCTHSPDGDATYPDAKSLNCQKRICCHVAGRMMPYRPCSSQHARAATNSGSASDTCWPSYAERPVERPAKTDLFLVTGGESPVRRNGTGF